MAQIPKDARWYIADLILEHQIAGDAQNVVHVNTHLIEAASPDEAYSKCCALGKLAEGVYENTGGTDVRVVFRGIRELNVIHDALEDGAELTYTEFVGVPEEELEGMVPAKEELAAFAPITPRRRSTAKPESDETLHDVDEDEASE